VCALGAGDMLVGRSHECDNPEYVKDLPACSRPAFDVSVSSGAIDAEVRRRLRAGEPLYCLDAELIQKLGPDLVLTQAHCEVCAVTAADVERSGACIPSARQIALSASSIEDIFASIGEIARALELEEKGHAVVHHECKRMEQLRQETATSAPPSVVMLEWTDPPFVMGNWGPELVEWANGEPLVGRRAEYSKAIPGEEILAANPEYIIVAPCGFNLERSEEELPVLEQYPWWQELRAVQTGKVAFADGNRFFNRSGMTICESVEIIAEILHGRSYAQTPGVRWRWMEDVASRTSGRGHEESSVVVE
jgi:iron complex transport system substrate-binding protein